MAGLDQLLDQYDRGTIGRRQLLGALSLVAGAGSVAAAALGSATVSAQTTQGAASASIPLREGTPTYPNTPVSRALVERYRKMALADVWHELYRVNGVNCHTGAVRAIAPGMKLCGRAVTLGFVPSQRTKDWRTPGSRDFEHWTHALTYITEPGDIGIIDMGGYMEAGLVGGNVAAGMKHFGMGGLIIDGACRDTEQILATGLPVFTRGTAIAEAHGMFRTVSLNNAPVQVGSISISPGDIVLADVDGLLVVPADLAEGIIANIEKRAEWEERSLAGFKRGEDIGAKTHQVTMDAIDPSIIRNVPKGGFVDPRKK